jgi:hypothetical protein
MRGITGRALTVALRMTELIRRRRGRNRWVKKPGILWLMRG